VRVNGNLIQTPDYWIDLERDRVTLDGVPVSAGTPRYILLYKPRGYITTYRDPQGRPTVYDLLSGVNQFVAQVGRLDLETSGLLLLTNDTQLAEMLTNPGQRIEKTYLVKASGRLTEEQIDSLRSGVELNDGPTLPAIATRLRESDGYTTLELTITEGRNRQVRRMLEAVGSKVVKLVRTKMGSLTLEGLSIGRWRELSRAEVEELKHLGSQPGSRTKATRKGRP
jgi:23S rRNA pseudouridine2605 synthase